MRNSPPPLLLLLVLPLWIQIASQLAGAYTTYIVGGDTGWTIPTASNTVLNYTAWASNLTASLGDSLVFRYDPSHTVVQTNNVTTFQSCDATADDETLQIWSSSGSSDSTVMLTTTGTTYFFCSAGDGSHCRDSGMRFALQVSHGQGLPATPMAAPSPQDGSDGGGDDLNFPNFDKFAPPPPPPPSPPAGDSSAATAAASFQLSWMVAAVLVLARLSYIQ